MLRLIVAAILLWLILPAFAHDGHNDDWFRSLKNGNSFPCCDGSDAVRVEDPDWDIQDGKYRVKLDGTWQIVPPQSVVKATNIVGYAIVWPVGGQVRCFLPGSTS